jgi:hypothetical protein
MTLVSHLIGLQEPLNKVRLSTAVTDLNQSIQESSSLFVRGESSGHGLGSKNMAAYRRGLTEFILCRGFMRIR